ncbi:hypothetical protein [Pseudoalteromonas piscicida]
MNQFDKNQIITLDIQNPQQIELALAQCKALLDSDKACFNSQFDVELKQLNEEGMRRLQPQDSGNNLKLLQSALDLGQAADAEALLAPLRKDKSRKVKEAVNQYAG